MQTKSLFGDGTHQSLSVGPTNQEIPDLSSIHDYKNDIEMGFTVEDVTHEEFGPEHGFEQGVYVGGQGHQGVQEPPVARSYPLETVAPFSEWQEVRSKRVRSVSPVQNARPKVWRETERSKAARAAKSVAITRAEAAAKREAQRSANFLASLSKTWPVRESDASDTEVATPSMSRSPRSFKRQKVSRQTLRQRANRGAPSPLPTVSKAEAAAPVLADPPSVVANHIAIQNTVGSAKVTEFETFRFPKLGFLGLWNDSHSASSYNHANHWGVHVKQADEIEVTIFKGLVAELSAYLATRQHDAKFANYAVVQVKALSLCRDPDTGLTAEQRMTSVMYAPALAYMLYWNELQNISRVVTQQHITFNFWKACLVASAGMGSLATHLYFNGAPTAPGPAPAPYLGESSWSRMKRWASTAGRGYGITKKFLTEISKPAPKPRRADASSEVGEPGPFVRPDVSDSVRPRVERVGPADPSFQPRAFENNLANQQAAVDARVLNETITPDEEWLNEFIREVKLHKDALFGKQFRIAPLEFEAWLKGSNASRSVKAKLKATYERLCSEGIYDISQLTPADVHRWTTRQSFVKEEFTNHRTPAGITEKASRLIQGGRPEFIVLVGPFIAALQGRFKKIWNVKSSICFVSGVNAQDAAGVIDTAAKVFEDDVSAYDASFVAKMLELEVWIAGQFGAPNATLQLMKGNVNCHGVTSHGIKYKRKGGRCSGDPYTSLFNSVLNGLMHLFIFAKERGCTMAAALKELRMLVSGDDNLGSHYGPEVDWKAGMAKFGFKAVPIYRPDPSKAEFCSMRFTPVEGGWTFVPKPGRVINKIAYCLDRPPNITPQQIIRGTALSLEVACSASPPLSAFIRRILELTAGVEPYVPRDEPWKMLHKVATPTTETWAQLADIYGWDTQKQAEWEYVLSQSTLTSELKHPYLDLLLEADTDGPTTYNDNDNDNVEDAPSGTPSYRPSCATEAVLSMGGWVRDLTQDGINPNPGPPRLSKLGVPVPPTPSTSQSAAAYVAVPPEDCVMDQPGATEPDYSFNDFEFEYIEDEWRPTVFCINNTVAYLARRLNRALIELVGIEPNPGPRRGMTHAQLEARDRELSRRRNARAVVVVRQPARPRRLPARQARRNTMGVQNNVMNMYTPPRGGARVGMYGGRPQLGGRTDKVKYMMCLSNPFDCPPVRLGGECMQPTGIATMTRRGVFDMTGASSLSIVVYPRAISPMLASVSTGAAYTYTIQTAFNWPGGPSLSAIAAGGRIIAAGIRVTCINNQANNQGVITLGCLPRNQIGAAGNDLDGIPYTASTASTQGFNEFFNYLQTESYPLATGASTFWRPEDPLDFTFRDLGVLQDPAAGPVGTELTPPFVVGISGASAATQLMVELITHIEYTVSSGTAGVVSTGSGTMSQDELIGAARVMAGRTNTTMQGVVGGLKQLAYDGAARLGEAALQQAGAYFSSTLARR